MSKEVSEEGHSHHHGKDYVDPPPAPLIDMAELKLWSFYRSLIAEFIATLLFLYITVATVIGYKKSDPCNRVGLLDVAWTFGGIIFALVYCTAGVSATMSKEKDKGKQIVVEPPKPVSTKPGSPIEIANRFTTLGSTSKPASFASTVSTTYIKKMCSWNLFYIESNRSIDADPYKIATRYFPPNFHWIPENLMKNLQYYCSILILTNSLVIKPIYDQTDSSKQISHSAYISQLITEEDWGAHSSTSKQLLDSDIIYNYYDYIDAWFKFMLFQTPEMSHSWILNFDKKFKGKFPLWFNKWWHEFGLIPEIFPEELQQAFKCFQNEIPARLDRYMAKFPYSLHFCKWFKTPWILKWSYEKNGDMLMRYTFVKWWDKFPHMQNIINSVIKEFSQAAPDLKNSEDFLAIDRSSLIQAPAVSTKEKATASSYEKSVKCSKSKKKNVLKGLTKKDLIYLLQQLVKEDNSDSDNSEASSVAPYSNCFVHDSEDTSRLSDD
ncbi:uncharacterized protein LOC122297650 [Carya illinoinensis]|uniref:uncharacterized protein LOC122297650 n=1 Tax=Carya illinoinensis TaxID=32201 RepID=UPI001C7275F6|nr:uncharacterized protein LOC122297650 [Carya illinoinensis]